MKVHELVSDELWQRVEPLLPPHPPQPKGGNQWKPDRPALCGIIYVFKTGIGWNDLPLELGCGSGSTCWRRLRDWQAAGVWARLHKVLLNRLEAAGRIRWDRAALDSTAVAAKRGVPRQGRTRRTAAGRAPNATWSPTPKARRSA